MERRFSFTWSVFQIGDAAITETTSEEAAEAYEAFKLNLQQQFDQFLSDVVVDLRYQVQNTCLNLKTRIESGELVNGNSIKAVNSMIDKFMSLNFVGDKAIQTKLDELRATLRTLDPKELKTNEAIKTQLGNMAGDIAKAAADLSDLSEITGTYKRSINLD